MELDSDPSLSVGIITGAGGYFCAGMDLKAFISSGMRLGRWTWFCPASPSAPTASR